MGFKTGSKTADKPKEKSNGDFCNIVHLAGRLESKTMSEKSAFILINPTGQDGQKYVPCTLYGEEDAPLADKLDLFENGDFIKLVGFLRPWSQKIDGKWQNKMEVRITEIKSEPPKRGEKTPAGWHGATDDDIPF